MKAGRLRVKRQQLKVKQATLAKRVSLDYRVIKAIEMEEIGIDQSTFTRLDEAIDYLAVPRQEDVT